MQYRVEVLETWIQGYLVEADSPEEARKKAIDGEPIDNDQEYVDTIGVREADDAVRLYRCRPPGR